MKNLIKSIETKQDKALAIGMTISALAIIAITILTTIINTGTIS